MRLLHQARMLLSPTSARQRGGLTASWSAMVLAQVDLTPDPSEIDSSWVEGMSPAAQKIVELVFEILQWASVAVLVAAIIWGFFQLLKRDPSRALYAVKWVFGSAILAVLTWTGLGLTLIDGIVNVVTSSS